MSFANLRETGVEEEKDRIGGGFAVPESDIYDLEIKIGYLGKAQSGAQSVTLLGTMGGEDFRQTIYFTSGTAKGGGITYTNQKTGKKHYLPGYQALDDLCYIATNGDKGLLDLLDSDLEDKVVKLYDPEQSKEVNSTVKSIAALQGAKVKAAWKKKLENKSEKTDNGYVPTAETRETGEVVKFLSTEGFHLRELMEEKESPEWSVLWLEKNKGMTQDSRTIKDGGTAGAPPAANSAAPAASPKKKLFGNKSN